MFSYQLKFSVFNQLMHRKFHHLYFHILSTVCSLSCTDWLSCWFSPYYTTKLNEWKYVIPDLHPYHYDSSINLIYKKNPFETINKMIYWGSSFFLSGKNGISHLWLIDRSIQAPSYKSMRVNLINHSIKIISKSIFMKYQHYMFILWY